MRKNSYLVDRLRLELDFTFRNTAQFENQMTSCGTLTASTCPHTTKEICCLDSSLITNLYFMLKMCLSCLFNYFSCIQIKTKKYNKSHRKKVIY